MKNQIYVYFEIVTFCDYFSFTDMGIPLTRETLIEPRPLSARLGEHLTIPHFTLKQMENRGNN